jgi:hypothetical protein
VHGAKQIPNSKFQIPNKFQIQNPQIHHSTTSPLHHSPPSPQTPKEFNVNSPGIYPGVEGENARISPPQMVIVNCIKNSMGGDQGEGRGGIHVTLYLVRFSFFISWNIYPFSFSPTVLKSYSPAVPRCKMLDAKNTPGRLPAPNGRSYSDSLS